MTKNKNHSYSKTPLEQVKSKEGITDCIRCCTCCAKGGPALHLEDRKLIETGKLHGRFLVTIREGEPAEDNVKGGMIFTNSDIIKIKSKENSDACLYSDLINSSCSIYENRPLECRVLKCWDTKEIENIYNKDRLTRKDIIGHISGLWEIIEEHQEKCSFSKIKCILDQNPGKLEGDALGSLLEAVQYDISIRSLLIEKTDTDPNLLPFLLGNPLQGILKKFGIELKKREK
ncbi:YkgJ family cysteine cluster protein [bacterium]|nr:YkgJ family cysteine cluster protein [bacterium]